MKYILMALIILGTAKFVFAQPMFYSFKSPDANGNIIPVPSGAAKNITLTYGFGISMNGQEREEFILKIKAVLINPNQNDTVPLMTDQELDSRHFPSPSMITGGLSVTIPAGSVGKRLGLQYTWGSSSYDQPNGPEIGSVIFTITEAAGHDTTSITSTPMPIVIKANSLIAVFAKMTNDNVSYKSKLPAEWTAWQDLSGSIRYSPVPLSKDDQTMDVFVIGTDNHLYQKWWSRPLSSNASQGWSAWNNFGGSFASSPAVISKDNGQTIDLLAVGLDNHLYHKWWTLSQANNASGGWSQWADMGAGFSSTPTIISRNNGNNMDLFATGTNGHLYHRWYSKTQGWSAWSDFGGSFSSSPAAISKDGSSIDVFLVGIDNQLYHQWYSTSLGWSGWNTLGSNFTGTPAVVTKDGGIVMDIFVTGTDGHLHYKWWTNSNGWSGWNDFGGNLQSPPTAICKDNQSIDVFAQGTNNSLIRKSYSTNSGWANWEVVSGN